MRTFSTSNGSLAMLLITLYPRLPSGPNDNRCHLQASLNILFILCIALVLCLAWLLSLTGVISIEAGVWFVISKTCQAWNLVSKFCCDEVFFLKHL